MPQTSHLVIFARAPRAGAGKRRLAAGIGAVAAVRFERIRLRVLLARLGRDRRWRTAIAATLEREGPWPRHIAIIGQGHGDLGARMARVFARLPPGPAIIIGTDIPGIGKADIASAFRALGNSDAVLGPAGDGGYYLIGLRGGPRRRLPLRAVRWSSRHALSDTEANLAGLRIAHLRTLEDVDDAMGLAGHARWARLV